MNGGKKSLSILTAIQIIFFGLVVLTALVIKLVGAPVYPTVEQWYAERVEDSIIANTAPESGVSSQWSSALATEPSRNESSPSASGLGDVSGI